MMIVIFSILLFGFSDGAPSRGEIKIWGGNSTNIKNWPFLVSVSINGNFACAGALLNSDWIITVASCVYNIPTPDITVRAGSSKTGEFGQMRTVETVKVDKGFSPLTNDNNIAVVKVSESFEIKSKVKPVEIAVNPTAVGQSLRLAGWGDTVTKKIGLLKKLSLKKISLRACRRDYPNHKITDRLICAWGDSNGAPCWGDFGDPLVNRYNRLVGLFSWTQKCGETPSLFVDIQPSLSWIQKQMETS